MRVFPVPVGALAREAVAVARTCTDPVVRAEVLSMTVGDAARDAADVEALLAELDEAITASAGRDEPRQQERHNIAAIMLRYVDPVEAERNAHAMTGGHLVGRSARTADLLLDRGEWEQALATLADASDRSFTGLPNPRLAALIAVRRATALTGGGRLDEARGQLEEAASNERLGGLPPLVSAAAEADLERAAGQPALAAAALERALHGLDDEAMRTRFVLPLRWRRAVCRRERMWLIASRCSQVPKAASPRKLPSFSQARMKTSCVRSSAPPSPAMRRAREWMRAALPR